MFEKVLVALDFSAYSQRILDCIPEIPGIKEAVLIHVVDATHPSRLGWTNEPYIENARILIAEKRKILTDDDVPVRIGVEEIVDIITEGDVATAILAAAEEKNVSLIVMGARGINPIQELLLGGVSSSVIRHAKTNVLIVHYNPRPDDARPDPRHRQLFSSVLVPTDFSEPAGAALSFVTTIPGIQNVVLLHVVNRAGSKPEIHQLVKDAELRLVKIERDLAEHGIAAQHHIRIGDPTEMILSVAQEDDISLLAMSAHGTGWVREMVLGSTTFTVVRRTRKPVLVIRTGTGETG